MTVKKSDKDLKAGALIEDDESNDNKMPSARQLMKLENNIDKLPTREVLRRMYKRHSTGVWQTICLLTWAAMIYAWVM